MLLQGTRVLEWTEGLSGAFCARILGDFGAEVIKVEAPGCGDRIRREGPALPDGDYGDSLLFGYVNHGKRSITLDPGSPTGAELFLQLAARSDILIETEISAGRAAGHLDVAALRARNPKLVVVTITALGLPNTDAAQANTPLTLQHRSAYAYHQAIPVTDPGTQPPVGCVDREGPLAIGVSAVSAALWGVLVAETGDAPHIDLAGHDFYAAHLYPGPLAAWCKGEREFARKRGEFGGTEVAGGLVWMLECADGWIVCSPREQHQWERWMLLLGNPEWSHDKALCGDRSARRDHSYELQQLMSQETKKMTRQHLYAGARRERVACFPVNDSRDLLQNEQLRHRRYYDTLVTRSGKEIPVAGLPFLFTAGNGSLPRARTVTAPALGEGNRAILGERLGLTPAELEALSNGGVV